MLADVPRETFLALCQIKSSTLDQRTRVGETALALGCERPARPGWYLVLDGVAMILASVLNRRGGLQLKQSAEIVRERGEDWLLLLTKAERLQTQQCICVAWTLDRTSPPHIIMGDIPEITQVLGSETTAPFFVSMQFVLGSLRANARDAGIDLPERLTVAPDEPGYENWRSEIAAYQERAGARVAKIKPLTPA